MKTISLVTILFFISGVIFTSCEKPIYVKANFQKKCIQFHLSALTKVTDTKFEPGDKIGIYVVHQSTGYFYGDNKCYQIDNTGNLQPFSESDKISLSPTENYDVYAYYPYSKYTYNPRQFTLPNYYNQTLSEEYKGNDIMFSKTPNIAGDSPFVTLDFKRKFALVEVQINNANIKNVTLYNMKYKSIANLFTGEITTEERTSLYSMHLFSQTANQSIFRAIVPVQTMQSSPTMRFMVVFTDNHYSMHSLKTTVLLEAGKKSVFTLTTPVLK